MRTISAKVSDELYEIAKKKAEENNLTISSMLKQAFTTATIKDKSVEIALAEEINRVGNNLNQISRHANIHKALDRSVLASIKFIEQRLDEVLP